VSVQKVPLAATLSWSVQTMPSGRRPDVERRRRATRLRAGGLTLESIAQKLGVSRQAVWSLLNTRPQRTKARALTCRGCGALIVSAGALRADGDTALCLDCVEADPDVSFGQRLKALRLAAGLTRSELAVQSGIAPGSIRAYEDERRTPHLRSIARLASLLGNHLLSCSESPKTPPGDRRTRNTA
jgi:transcriptional regulator with XRE-family HTH domain